MMDRHASPATPSARAMDKYEQLSVVGEGSYGVVLKCRRRDNGKLVAIKKFLETEDDATVRKMALREIRMLKKLRHDHLVNLIEVFRRKRRFYLVFEYLDHTLLDELEATPGGLGEDTSKKRLFQLLRGIEYCHQNSIIHRDVKPENVLVSNVGIVKLCDLGFARTLAAPGEPYTEYVATRWYRAPELLVADHKYGPEVDIWAIGCLFAEMLTGDPLFPGDSDIDQLALIVKTVGKLASRHQQIVSRLSDRPVLQTSGPRGTLPGTGLGKELLAACLRTEPRARPTANALLRHKYFQQDNFFERFAAELRLLLGKDVEIPPATSKTYGPARSTKSQPQWTINIIPDPSKTPETNVSDQLIDYNFSPYTPGQEDGSKDGNAEKITPKTPPPRVICPSNPPPSLKPDSLPPPSRTGVQKQTAQQKSINKAINETFQMIKMRTGQERVRLTDEGFRTIISYLKPDSLPPISQSAQKKSINKAANQTFQNFSVPVNSYPRTHYIKKINNKLVTDEELMKGRPTLHKPPKKVAPSELSLPYVPGASNSPMKKAKKPTYKAYESYDAARPEVVASKTPTSLPYV